MLKRLRQFYTDLLGFREFRKRCSISRGGSTEIVFADSGRAYRLVGAPFWSNWAWHSGGVHILVFYQIQPFLQNRRAAESNNSFLVLGPCRLVAPGRPCLANDLDSQR